jgi:glycosyltransferase involved in cell wall biosynthesis
MIKAFGNGIPVISTPIGIVDKIFNRKNLLMYRFNDHNTLSDLIIELIENPNLTEKLSNNGRNLSKEFNADKISSYYQSLYNQLLNVN